MAAKTRYVRDLRPSETITDYFLVQSKDVRLKKDGEPYLSMVLSDRTGRLEAKMWEGIEEVVGTFDSSDFVKVQGLTQVYRHRPQMTVQRLRRADESEVRLADYIPHTEKNVDEMFSRLLVTVDEMQNLHLKCLLQAFLDDGEIAARLKTAPAAKSLHHAFIGGLLEHITSLLELASGVAGHYEFIDQDLLTAGIVLHDLGKIYELDAQRTFEYTDEGRLLGHITIVLRMLDRKCNAIDDFPTKWKVLVEHMILSHHGKYEFGSPKLPSFPEALALHYLDDLDSKLHSMRAALADSPMEDGDWTAYSRSLQRFVLNKEKFLAGSDDSPETRPAEESSETGPSSGSRRPAAPEAQQDTPGDLFNENLGSTARGREDR